MSENRCINEAETSIDGQTVSLGAAFATSDNSKRQKLAAVRDRKVLECKAKATRDRDELSARARAAYQDNAQEKRDQESLMMILITSKPH